MSPGTVYHRASIARRWIDFVGDPFDPVLTWRDVDAFLDLSNMRAPKSRYTATSHLHQFYLWAMRHDLALVDPTALVVRPRLTAGLPRPAHDTDLALGLAVATGPMRAAIVLAALCGLRCVELGRLRWCDVGFDHVRVRGKGDRERVIPIPVVARDALDDLERDDEYVFPWRVEDGIAPGWRASKAIGEFFRSIGCTTTAHQLRHWCGTNAYRTTGDLAAVQDYLGHASPVTTRVYAQCDPDRLRGLADSMALPV